jgi:hypothetical protein
VHKALGKVGRMVRESLAQYNSIKELGKAGNKLKGLYEQSSLIKEPGNVPRLVRSL